MYNLRICHGMHILYDVYIYIYYMTYYIYRYYIYRYYIYIYTHHICRWDHPTTVKSSCTHHRRLPKLPRLLRHDFLLKVFSGTLDQDDPVVQVGIAGDGSHV